MGLGVCVCVCLGECVCVKLMTTASMRCYHSLAKDLLNWHAAAINHGLAQVQLNAHEGVCLHPLGQHTSLSLTHSLTHSHTHTHTHTHTHHNHNHILLFSGLCSPTRGQTCHAPSLVLCMPEVPHTLGFTFNT